MYGARELVVVLALLLHGGCDQLSDQGCRVQDGVATCGDQFAFPLKLPENVTKLHIHSTHVKSIRREDFEEYTELETIDLSDCAITSIETEAFAAQPNLMELNLAGNREFSMNFTFITSDRLTHLNLSNTGVTTIPEDFFSGLSNLKELDLSAPSLELPIPALSQLANLSLLILLKDSQFDKNEICENTNLETIVFKIEEADDMVENCTRRASNESGVPEFNDGIETTTLVVDAITESATLAHEQGSEPKISVNDESIGEVNPVDNTIEDGDETEKTDDADNKENDAEDETSTTTQNDEQDETTIQPEGRTRMPDIVQDHGNQEETVAEKESAVAVGTSRVLQLGNVSAETENNQGKSDDSGTDSTDKKKDDGTDLTDKKKDDGTNAAGKKKDDGTNAADKKKDDDTNAADKKKDDGTDSTDKKEDDSTDAADKKEEDSIPPAEQNDQKPKYTPDAPKGTDVSGDVEPGPMLDNAVKKDNLLNAEDAKDSVDDAKSKLSEVTSQEASQSSGTNIVLGIIVTVMVVGALGFGYKYWKSRRSGYSNANTEETIEDGKELQAIVTDPEQN